jgi:predicted enzyme related to lactoylglutathione lyase
LWYDDPLGQLSMTRGELHRAEETTMAANDQQETKGSGGGVDASLARHGGLSYLAIPAVDPRRSAAFYEKVLGWKVEERDAGDFRFVDATGHLIGQWVTGRVISREPGLLPYMYVDHVDDAVTRALAHGGEVVKAPYAEGNLRVATVRDPAGNVIGLWQEAAG